MTASILAILAALAIPLAIWLRWVVVKKTSKKAEIAKQYEENRNAIADGSASDVLEQRLNSLPPSSGKGH